MKKPIVLLIFILISFLATAQISGTVTVGATGADYTSLTNDGGLFETINNTTVSADVYAEIISDITVETGKHALNQWTETGTGNYTITIRPDGNTLRTIEGDYRGTDDSDEGLFRLDSVSRVIIDGRDPNNLSAGGRYLLFRNIQERDVSHPAYYYRSTFNFINGSHNDTLRNIIVEANTEEVGDGIIHFGRHERGNYNILVDSCYIRSLTSDPTEHVRTGIYSYGVSSSETNHDITISNNHFINIWDDNGNDNHGIYITGYSTDFTITGNHFYLNATRDMDANVSNYGVYIYTEAYGVGDNFIIEDNYFGGSAPYCGGSPWTYTDGDHHVRYTGIKLETKDNSTGCIIENNKINNFEWYQYGYDYTPEENLIIFSGIQNGSGNSIIRNNIIGAPEGTDSISLYCGPENPSSGDDPIKFHGIWVNKGNVTIENNTIGAIKSYPSAFGTDKSPFQIEGIHISELDLDNNDNTGDVVVKNNLIGSLNTANSIEASAPSKISIEPRVIGIYLGSHGLNIADNNIIANMHNGNDYYDDAQTVGVYTPYDGQKYINNNQIYNLTTTCYDPGSGYTATIVGIRYQSNTNTVDSVVGNEIYNLKNLVTNDDVGVCGIGVTATSKTADLVIARNNIHSLSLESTDDGSTIYGMYFYSTRTIVKNNMIRLGIDADGNSITNDYEIVGIHQASNNCDVNYNTVYIGGNLNSGINNTYAFQRTYGTSTTDLYNNIFINERSNTGGTGVQYSVHLEDNANVNSDYNVLRASATNGVTGNLTGTDYLSLNDWQTAISDDANSLSGEVYFVDKLGDASTVDLHIDTTQASIVESAATIISPIPNDIDLEIRYGSLGSISSGTAPDIGADEINFTTYQPLTLSVTASPTTICEGETVQLEAIAGDGSGTYTYSWESDPVGFTDNTYNPVVNPTTTTTYYVTVDDGVSNITDQVTVTVNPLPTVEAGADQTICEGTQVTLTGSGTASSYTWDNSVTNGVPFTPVATTTYTVTGTDGNSCTNTDQVIVTVNPLPTVEAGADQTICEGTQVTLTGSGTASSYTWDNSVTDGVPFTPTATTTYTVTGTDANSCTNTDQVTVSVTTAPDAGTNGSITVCEGDPSFDMFGQLGGSPTGGGTWTDSGNNTVSNMFDPSTQSSETFTYTVTGTSPCPDASADVTVTVNPLPAVSFTGLDTAYCGAGDLILLTGNHAPDGTFAGQDVTDNGDGTADYTHATPGNYDITYTYTNSYGCTNIDTQNVDVYSLPNVSFVGLDTAYCQGTSQVNITGNHSPDGTFSGDNVTDNGNGSAVFVPSMTGSNMVSYQYTDNHGCVATDVQHTEVYPNPDVNSVNIIDVTVCSPPWDGEITVNATGGGLEYAIDTGSYTTSNNFTNLNVGSHTVYVIDSNGCETDTNVTVNSNTGFTIDSVEVVEPLCYGDSSATIIIHADSAVLYSIDNGVTFVTDSVFTGLGAGTYNINAQDQGNCPAAETVVINQPSQIIIDTSITDAVCGSANGQAYVSVSGGTPPYSYYWSNGTTDSLISSVYPGTYYLTVSDDNGCSDSLSLIINSTGGILNTSIINIVDNDCFGDSTGKATVQVSGTGNYSYLWSTGDTSQTITGLTEGYYYVTVSDSTGCSGIDTAYIDEPAPLNVTGTITDVACYGETSGSISITVTGGTPSYDYVWMGPNGFSSTDEDISGLATGGYYVTITDSHGCSFTQIELSVEQPDKPITPAITTNDPSCYGYEDGMATLSVSGGTPPYIYYWDNGDNTDSTSNLNAGVHYYTVTDANLCEKTDTFYLSEPEKIEIGAAITEPSCNGNNDGKIQISVAGGNKPYSFIWDDTEINNDSIAENLLAGEYSVSVSDANKCFNDTMLIVAEGEGTCLFIPSVYTPNNDGTNDKWEIVGIELYDKIEIEIYNRWGDLIYEYSGTGMTYKSNLWDGTYKGRQLSISSYVYIVNLNNGQDPIQGIVTIKK